MPLGFADMKALKQSVANLGCVGPEGTANFIEDHLKYSLAGNRDMNAFGQVPDYYRLSSSQYMSSSYWESQLY